MPRVIEYVSVGFCDSYGIGDWSIHLQKVEELPRDKIDELMLTMFHAQRQMWEFWWQKNQPREAAAQPLSETQS